jgi:glucosamine-6-phosphate deaminase
MNTEVFDSKAELGVKSAKDAEKKIRNTIEKNGSANVILATGASQFETLKNLVVSKEIDWSKVVMFHLDEYVGMSDQHPASFRKYLKERFVDKVGDLKAVHFIEGDAEDVEAECERLNEIIRKHPIDVALVGIGENGHLAFNDPPADFDTEEPYIVVELDEACRKQQMGEGWFETFDDVPEKAISMSIKQILKSASIICSVPDQRKAKAVQECLEGEISNIHPASILQTHHNCTVYLDKDSASLLTGV